MSFARSVATAGMLGALVLGCGGTSRGGSGGGSDPGITLSAAALAPGDLLTIRHGSLVAGSIVEVTFKGAGAYALTAQTALTQDGAATIPVPPYLDTETAATTAVAVFTTGTVEVSVAGIASHRPLRIQAVPALAPAVPGETLRTVVRLSVQSLTAAKADVAAAAADTGRDPQALTARLDAQIAALKGMDAELATGQLTLTTPAGPYVLRGQELALAESLVAAAVRGVAGHLAVQGAARATAGAPFSIEEPLLAIRNRGIPGAQALGSFLSVVAGAGGMLSAPWTGPMGPFIGGVAGIAITALSSAGTAGAAYVTEWLLDAARGDSFDEYRAAQRAEAIFYAGFRSTAIALLGIAEWPVSWIGWASVANDLRDMLEALRDVQCQAYDVRALRVGACFAAAATREAFCAGTRGSACTSAFRCHDGVVVCADRVCNGRPDCPDASDESPLTDCGGDASCCIATQGCPLETATTCAQTCCCCPYGQTCSPLAWSTGCVGTRAGPLSLKQGGGTSRP